MSLSKKLFDIMPEFAQKKYVLVKNKRKFAKWKKDGCLPPVPHIVKQEAIKYYRDKYNINTLVETGTYLGDMVWAQQDNFKKIYSIELSEALAENGKKRFAGKPHIEVIQGDSGQVMSTLINKLPEKTLFWLDGHYSSGNTACGDKECPILEEVKAILSSGVEHILLIDDARCFTGENDYPTIEYLSGFILESYPNSIIEERNDAIIVELKK